MTGAWSFRQHDAIAACFRWLDRGVPESRSVLRRLRRGKVSPRIAPRASTWARDQTGLAAGKGFKAATCGAGQSKLSQQQEKAGLSGAAATARTFCCREKGEVLPQNEIRPYFQFSLIFGARQITWPCHTKIRDNLGMTTSSDLLWSQLLCNSNATSFAIISEFGSEALVVGIFWLNSDVYCFATWKIHYFANILGVSTCTFTPKNVIASKGFMLIQICLGPWRYYGGKILKKHAAPEPGMLSRL